MLKLWQMKDMGEQIELSCYKILEKDMVGIITSKSR